MPINHATIPAADVVGGVGHDQWAEAHTLPTAAEVGALTQAVADTLYAPLIYQAFPVGAIFVSAVSTNPATLLGYGTWSAIGAGRVLIGQDTNDTDFDVLGETGGAKTVAAAGTLSGIAVSDHAAHTHSVTSNVAVANHTATQPTIAWPAGVPTASGAAVADHAAHTHSVTSNVTVADHAAHTHTYTDVVNHVHANTAVLTVQGGTTASTTGTHVMTSTATGGSARAVTTGDSIAVTNVNPTGAVGATGTTANPSATLTHTPTNNAVTSGNPSATLTHSVTQPTVAWPAGVPTAASGGVDAHGVTNNAVTSGNPNATLTHTVSNQGTFTGSTTSVVPPYLVVKFWQRTA